MRTAFSSLFVGLLCSSRMSGREASRLNATDLARGHKAGARGQLVEVCTPIAPVTT